MSWSIEKFCARFQIIEKVLLLASLIVILKGPQRHILFQLQNTFILRFKHQIFKKLKGKTMRSLISRRFFCHEIKIKLIKYADFQKWELRNFWIHPIFSLKHIDIRYMLPNNSFICYFIWFEPVMNDPIFGNDLVIRRWMID